ncbi:MAG: sorbosone dehydrogenase family protein [Anaerolineales bacterium]|nr:sorbosone dehydrogenase family protein [Anaerolineales bacterium]
MVLLLIAIAGGVWLYVRFGRQVNLVGSTGEGGVANVQVPEGFEVNVFAEGLNGPRFIAFGPDGVLYVADRGAGRIVALPDANGDGVADEVRVFAEGLNSPHSLVYHEGSWYIGVPTGVVRLTDTDGDGKADEQTILIDDYPTGGHSTRTVLFLPDGRMIVSVGSSCNVCEEEDSRRAGIVVYNGPDATGEKLFATGLRNAVGLALHPETGELWATNNGRDMLGDDLPPETVNRVLEGADFGWPRCHSGFLEDPEFGFDGSCEGVEPPAATWQAHTAPLGLAFYIGTNFPEEYRGDLFIALHGSWNHSSGVGYSIIRVTLDGSTPTGEAEDFATGWLADNFVSGRPVGLAVGPDGALYVSDDKGGFIYRIGWTGN